MRYQLGLWGLSCGLLASACSLDDVDSDAIRTQGMFANMLALAAGNGTTLVRVDLTVGGEGGTHVTLVGDDQLDARFGEVSATLRRSGHGRYQTELEGEGAGPVSVEFSRGPDDAAAGGSAELPVPFITALGTDATAGIARGSSVAVTWSPPAAGGSMRWSVAGRCIWSESGVTPDDGSVVLGAESFRVRATRSAEDCEVEVVLERENGGAVDGTWTPGSRFRAIQRRGVAFVSTPAPTEEPTFPEPPPVPPAESAPDAG